VRLSQEATVSASSDLRDILRRHAVGSQAELTVEATTAAMAIRAARVRTYTPRDSHLYALRRMLDRIDQVATYKNEGLLPEFINDDKVTHESLELVQVMARAAHQDDDTAGHKGKDVAYEFPVLDSLVKTRDAVEIDGNSIHITDDAKAGDLADGLEALARDVLSDAIDEDRSRTSSYAVI
jgi:hypothetical protein